MLNAANTLGGSGASLSLDARVAVGAGVFTVGAAGTSAQEPKIRAVAAPEPKQTAYNYNAFEFAYRADYGKIILLQQNVETGQEVTQVPNEYHLRQYAATQREQRVQLQQKLYKGSGEKTQQAAPTAATTTANTAVSTSAPAASPPASPSVAPSAVAAATVAHVDIKA
jgi:hypothetical protein